MGTDIRTKHKKVEATTYNIIHIYYIIQNFREHANASLRFLYVSILVIYNINS